jgi:regulator of RNase E activity RraA
MELSAKTKERLGKVSTATLCTALFKRGFRNVYIQGISRMTTPSGGNLVGPAFTMRSIPAREDLDQISAFDDPNHPQRKAIESVPPGYVLVLDCRQEKRVASGGEILTTRLKVRGGAGLVSDGPVRDSGSLKNLDFPIYCAGGSARSTCSTTTPSTRTSRSAAAAWPYIPATSSWATTKAWS